MCLRMRSPERASYGIELHGVRSTRLNATAIGLARRLSRLRDAGDGLRRGRDARPGRRVSDTTLANRSCSRSRQQFDHVQWRGCSFWDLIQPSFMFLVGVAMPFSYASRQRAGREPGRGCSATPSSGRSSWSCWRSSCRRTEAGGRTSSSPTCWPRSAWDTCSCSCCWDGPRGRPARGRPGDPGCLLAPLRALPGQSGAAVTLQYGKRARMSRTLPGFFAHWNKNRTSPPRSTAGS